MMSITRDMMLALPFVALLALQGCSDSDRPVTPDGGETADSGEKDLVIVDIGATSSPTGYTLIDLPVGELSEEIVAFPDEFPEPILASTPIGLQVPDDVVSLVLIAENEAAGLADQPVIVSSFKVPEEGEQVASLEDLTQHMRSGAFPHMGPGITTILRPRVAEHEVAGGLYQVQVALSKSMAEAGEVPKLRLGVRRGETADFAKLAVNLIFVEGNGIEEADLEEFASRSEIFDHIMGSVGVSVDEDRVGVGRIEDAALNTYDASYAAQLALQSAPVTELLPLTRDGALTFYIVREVAGGQAFGVSTGIPGALGTFGEAASSVIISAEAHRFGDALDFDEFWRTMTHEAGHWLGLNHTTEEDGTAHDPISDTPECPPSADLDGDQSLSAEECAGRGGELNMFWEGIGETITPHQGLVLRSNPIMQPHAVPTSCPDGTSLCGSECVDLQTSLQHCGACDEAVPEGGLCEGGVVTCGNQCDDIVYSACTCATSDPCDWAGDGYCDLNPAEPASCLPFTPRFDDSLDCE
jgi:hypothetical protein